MRDYCKVHTARLRIGPGRSACIGCGKGVKHHGLVQQVTSESVLPFDLNDQSNKGVTCTSKPAGRHARKGVPAVGQDQDLGANLASYVIRSNPGSGQTCMSPDQVWGSYCFCFVCLYVNVYMLGHSVSQFSHPHHRA